MPSKKLLLTDRRTQKGQYRLELGFELKNKTLGVIGLGSIGGRVAELGLAIGMKVIAYNRSPKKQKGVSVVASLNQLLKQSDAISLNVVHSPENKNMIGEKQIEKMKAGVIIVNTVDRDLVDEKAIAKALKTGKVGSYAYEGEDLINTPLAKLENCIGIKGFGWYTKEALANLYSIVVANVKSIANHKPQNLVQ